MKYDEIIAYARQDAAEEAAKEATILVKRDVVLELLEEYGEIPQSLRETIGEETDLDVLKKWLKLAAKAETIDEFMENM